VIVLDTSVLAYAAGWEHPLREPCVRLFDAIAGGRLAATTSPAVIQEFLHVHARRRTRAEAAARAENYRDVLAPLLNPEETQVDVALELFRAHPALDAFDAFLAAAAIESGARALVSADSAFAGVSGLRHVDPGSRDLDALLGAA
jgi:predicted nucleic acid-binding protein